jgi:methionyl-tRNA formyltransferase
MLGWHSVSVLFLGPEESPVIDCLRSFGEKVNVAFEQISRDGVERLRPTFIVCHGYQHILKSDVLAVVEDRAINLHIGYLPWNRGADPNLWSWLEDSPKGVTIHYVDEGVDTGDIVAQREVVFSEHETLASSYARLQAEMLELFREQWPLIRVGACERRAQQGVGSFHRDADRSRVVHLLSAGWQTNVADLRWTRGAK